MTAICPILKEPSGEYAVYAKYLMSSHSSFDEEEARAMRKILVLRELCERLSQPCALEPKYWKGEEGKEFAQDIARIIRHYASALLAEPKAHKHNH